MQDNATTYPEKSLMTALEEEKMYSWFMQDNATTYTEKSLMTALEEENVQLVYAGQCHDLPRKVLNDRPRRRKCTVGLCRTMRRPSKESP